MHRIAQRIVNLCTKSVLFLRKGNGFGRCSLMSKCYINICVWITAVI